MGASSLAIASQRSVEDVPSLAAADLAQLQREALAQIRLEPGTRGYEHQARSLRGVAALGSNDTLGEVAFASLTTGQVSNDHYATYELFWQRQSGKVLSAHRYFGDVAGLEGTTAAVIALTAFALGLPCAASAVLAITLIAAVAAQTARRSA